MRGENSTLRYDLPGYSPVYPKIFSITIFKMRSRVVYTNFSVKWRHKREMVVKSQDLDLKKKSKK